MKKKGRKRLLFWLKVFAVLAVATYTALSIRSFYTDVKSNTGQSEQTATKAAIDVSTSAAITISEQPKRSEEKQQKKKKKQKQEKRFKLSSEDEYILKKIAMAEAEDETVKGKALVMLVVMNRVKSKEFPDSVKKVVFQERQFSPVSNGRYDRVEPDNGCRQALNLIQYKNWDNSQGALYFESKSASNWHRDNLHFLFKYGCHYFYTERK